MKKKLSSKQVENLINCLAAVECIVRVNAVINYGSPMHKTIIKTLAQAGRKPA